MNCLHCNKNTELFEALTTSPFSWPDMSVIWYACGHCDHGNHIRIANGGYQQIKIIGAPGPTWKTIKSYKEASLKTRQDVNYLHVWLNGNHFEIQAKT